MPTRSARLLPLALALVVLTTSGCLYSREIAQTRRGRHPLGVIAGGVGHDAAPPLVVGELERLT